MEGRILCGGSALRLLVPRVGAQGGPRSQRGTGSEHRVEHVFYFTMHRGDSPSHEGGTWTGDIASPERGVAWVMVAK